MNYIKNNNDIQLIIITFLVFNALIDEFCSIIREFVKYGKKLKLLINFSATFVI